MELGRVLIDEADAKKMSVTTQGTHSPVPMHVFCFVLFVSPTYSLFSLFSFSTFHSHVSLIKCYNENTFYHANLLLGKNTSDRKSLFNAKKFLLP